MIRFATIFLALAVCANNAYCSCAAATTMGAQGAADERGSHACCRQTGQSDSDRSEPVPAAHRCPHCMGTLAMHQAGGKTIGATPAPAPFATLLVVESRIASVDFHSALLPNRTDLPPPGEACTLLNLSCSFLS